MKTYSEWRPTPNDTPGLNLEDRQDWLVVGVIRTRDSDALERSNFKAACSLVNVAGDDVEVHRFSHWGPGWFEIIIVRPGSIAVDRAKMIEVQLTNYPVLDEDDFASEELDEAAELWANSDVADRLHYIKRCGADPKVSMFAARRDELPEGIYASDLIRP